ncbi:hypothetical protein BJX76DRAFT_362365 [Aspergillus varians]
MPLTFMDAVEVCRCLGIEFLWVDSLCIMQDSENDWLTQSGKMCEYYSNSWITIAADGAADSTQGFLRDQKRKLNVRRFECPGEDGGLSQICVRRKGGNIDTFHHHVWSGPQQSALTYRGWTLQESILSPRILHYTAEEVTWECLVESRCECQVQPHSLNGLKMEIQNVSFNRKWSMIIDHYSHRNLTDQTDKLIAISGLARLLQAQTTSSYFAGLWSDQFPEALLWMTYDYNGFEKYRPSQRILQYQAPTWSWASVTGRIILASSSTSFVSDLEIVNISVVPLGKDLYGPLKGASIIARGYIAPVTVVDSSSGVSARPKDKFQILSQTKFQGEYLGGAVIADVHGTNEEIHPEQPYWVLFIGHSVSWSGLLLSKDHTSCSSYRRVGRLDGEYTDYPKWMTLATREEIELV